MAYDPRYDPTKLLTETEPRLAEAVEAAKARINADPELKAFVKRHQLAVKAAVAKASQPKIS